MNKIIEAKSAKIEPKKYVLKKLSSPTQYTVDYEKQLNPNQLKAVTKKEGSILVIAGAGSGKTKTLT